MKRSISIVLSLIFVLVLFPTTTAYAATLKITSQPKSSYTAYGATAKATVKANGDSLKYTWYIKNSGSKKYSKSSITKSTYSVKMSDSSKNRQLYCVVKDKKGKTVKSSTVVLRMKATITTQPKSTKVAKGSTAKVTVKAKGDGLKYTWYIKNAGGTKYSKSSITKSTYSVKMTDKVNGRYLYCVVTDKYGKTEKSKTVSLRVVSDPLTIVMQPESTDASPGDEVGFGIVVTGGTAPYKYQLKFANASQGGDWENVESEKLIMGNMTTLLFRISENNFLSNGLFCIVVTDAAGKQVTSNAVWVNQQVS